MACMMLQHSLEELQIRGTGVQHRIPKLLITASLFNNLLTIAMFSILIGSALSEGESTKHNYRDGLTIFLVRVKRKG